MIIDETGVSLRTKRMVAMIGISQPRCSLVEIAEGGAGRRHAG
jgi:hypothetical protein